MRGGIYKDGKQIHREKMTKEEQEEVKLYARWYNSKEKNIIETYAGDSIESIPEEYREMVEKFRSFGIGVKKSKLQKAKIQRDEAKEKNNNAIQLEKQVENEVEKRNKPHGEQ